MYKGNMYIKGMSYFLIKQSVLFIYELEEQRSLMCVCIIFTSLCIWSFLALTTFYPIVFYFFFCLGPKRGFLLALESGLTGCKLKFTSVVYEQPLVELVITGKK